MQISVYEYLEKAVREYPEKVAYQMDDHAITFSEVKELADRVGSVVAAHVVAKTPILVLADKHIRTPSLYFGIVAAGCCYVPLGADLPDTRIQDIIDISEAKVLFTERQYLERLELLDFKGRVLLLEDAQEEEINEQLLHERAQKVQDTDPIYMIFTSGSSGKPKGVVAQQKSVIDYIDVFAETFGIDDKVVFGNQAPLDYIAAIRDMYLPLCTGAKTMLIPKSLFSMLQILFDYINKYQVTTLCWVSSALVLCADLNAFDAGKLESVNSIFFTGSVMPGKQLRQWQQFLPEARFVNHYGPTEITASCTYYEVTHLVEEDEVIPIGIPFRNREIILLDENNQLVPEGEKGEICVKGSCLALGYFHDFEKTKEVFVNNPLQESYPEIIYKTGDLGRLEASGVYTFHGRKDFQIKHMGHRVELGEIETVAGALEGLKSCCCLYSAKKQQIFLFYTGEIRLAEIAKYLRKKLPAYMIPRHFIQLEAMPQTANGKINIQTLKERMEEK